MLEEWFSNRSQRRVGVLEPHHFDNRLLQTRLRQFDGAIGLIFDLNTKIGREGTVTREIVVVCLELVQHACDNGFVFAVENGVIDVQNHNTVLVQK